MKNYTMKVANMRTEQEFTLYPYSGGDDIFLQSDKRFARVNLRTGEGKISAKNRANNGFIDLAMGSLSFHLPDDIKTAIQKFLWHNDGEDGNINGVVFFENKQLFSE